MPFEKKEKTYLSNLSDKEVEKWADAQILQSAKAHGLTKEPRQHSIQSRLRHDLWSLYDYGDIIKVVYFKSLPDAPKSEPLFSRSDERKKPQFEKIPRSENERFSNSIARSRARIFELANCNEFTYFCTFTQDEEKRDRFDLSEFRKDFAQLVRNLNRGRKENSKIKYLLIPEQHQDGAWHMHGLMMGLTDDDLRPFDLSEKLPYRIREQIEKGVTVYDWTRYRKAFGYFTCTKIGNSLAVSKYITKYISKDLQKTVRESGEHLFFASQGLKGKDIVVKKSSDVCPVEKWDFENKYIKVAEIPKSEKADTQKYRELFLSLQNTDCEMR